MAAALLTGIDLPAADVEEFNRWYDEEHVPERLAVEGITTITRWQRLDGDWTRFAALFDAEDAGVFASGPYAALKARGDSPWTASLKRRFTTVFRSVYEDRCVLGGTSAAPWTAFALTDVPDDLTEPYRRWYDEEHGPAVATVPGVAFVRRLERATGDGARHLTILGLSRPDALDGSAYAAAKAQAPGDHLRAVWTRTQGRYERIRIHA